MLWASRHSRRSTMSAGTGRSAMTIPRPRSSYVRHDSYNRPAPSAGRTFCATAATMRDGQVFAMGGRPSGIDGRPGTVETVMDTEHTGVESGALDAYSRVVTGV